MVHRAEPISISIALGRGWSTGSSASLTFPLHSHMSSARREGSEYYFWSLWYDLPGSEPMTYWLWGKRSTTGPSLRGSCIEAVNTHKYNYRWNDTIICRLHKSTLCLQVQSEKNVNAEKAESNGWSNVDEGWWNAEVPAEFEVWQFGACKRRLVLTQIYEIWSFATFRNIKYWKMIKSTTHLNCLKGICLWT